MKEKIKSFPWRGALFISVGLLLVGWLLNTPAGLLGKADAIGYAVCHRIALRSFSINGRQMPLCARCSGMYLGAVLGITYLAVLAPRRGGLPNRRVGMLLALLVLAFAIDGVNSFISLFPGAPHLYQPQNWLRLLTGTGMGLVIAAFLVPAFNQTIWKEWDARPALAGGKSLVGLLALSIGLDILLLWQNSLILYPLALISAGGVLLILTLVYCIFWLILFKRDNRYNRIIEAGVALVAGFGTALAQIAAMDFVRYLLTHTWDGFHLG
jgi:uncharacterized membrane protein